LQAVVWDFAGFIGGTSKGSCPLSLGNENVKKYNVELPRNKKVKYTVVKQWLDMNEELTCRKVNYTHNTMKEI
jgi:hypothetical protein